MLGHIATATCQLIRRCVADSPARRAVPYAGIGTAFALAPLPALRQAHEQFIDGPIARQTAYRRRFRSPGGVAGGLGPYWNDLVESVKAHSLPRYRDGVPMELSILGAAVLTFRKAGIPMVTLPTN